MARQLCERFGCTKPAVAFLDEFVCVDHAPADVEAHS